MMDRRTVFRWGGLAVLGAAIPAACAPAQDAGRTPFRGNAPVEARVAEIRRAGAALGWRMEDVRPGVIRGTLNVRDQQAVVDIPYDAGGFDITYVSSRNLGDGPYLHYNYNRWVRNLRGRIAAQTPA